MTLRGTHQGVRSPMRCPKGFAAVQIVYTPRALARPPHAVACHAPGAQ